MPDETGLAALLKILEELPEVTNTSTEALGILSTAVDSTQSTAQSLSQSISQGSEYLSTFIYNSKETASVLSALSASLIGSTTAFDSFSSKSQIGSASLHNLSVDLKAIDSLSNSGISSGLGEIASVITKLGVNTLESAGKMSSLQQGLTNMLAVSGQLGPTAEDRVRFIRDIDRESTRFISTITDVGSAIGLSSEEVTGYASTLLQIPGAMSSVTLQLPGTTQQIGTLEAMMRVARGTTGNFADVQTLLSERFGMLGRSSVDSAEGISKTLGIMSLLSQTSSQLGLPFSTIRADIKDVSDSFAAFGDNTESAIKLINGFGRAMLDSGAGPTQMSRIIKGVTSSIKDMSLGSQAFLSAQTGGTGGLQGAFEIDLLKSQGRMDEIYTKMESALKSQFGGRIVTLEEASQSSDAAAQMTRQVQFLQQGPFGQLVQNRGDAYAMLRAFSEGTSPEVQTRTEALEGATAVDRAAQDKQTTILTSIANDTKYLMYLRDLQNLTTVRAAVGTETPIARQMMSEYSSQATLMGRGLHGSATSPAPEGALEVQTPGQEMIDRLGRIGNVGASVAKDTMQRYGEHLGLQTRAMSISDEYEPTTQLPTPQLRQSIQPPQLARPIAPVPQQVTATKETIKETTTETAKSQKIQFEPLTIKIEGLNKTMTQLLNAKAIGTSTEED